MAQVFVRAATPKVRWTKDDVTRLNTKTLRQQYFAAESRYRTAMSYVRQIQYRNTDMSSLDSFQERADRLQEYMEAIMAELKARNEYLSGPMK